MAPDVQLRVVSTADELDSLREPWSALHAASGAGVFQSWEWQRAWWRHLGEPSRRRTLHVVVATVAGEVVAIAPLFVDRLRSFGLVPLRRLVFLGTGLTDYLDVLVRAGFEERCFDALAAHLAADAARHDVVWLCDVPDGSRAHEGLFEALRRHGYEGERFVNESCPRTALRATWQETLAGFDGGHRRQLAKRTRQLREHHEVAVEVVARAEDVDRDVDEFIAMHQHRWTSVGKKGVFAEPAAAAFLRDVAREFFARGWLFLAFLRADGARVAALCGFRHGGALSYYLNGIRDGGDVRRYSPGLVLHGACMERLVGEGVRTYDFLRGTERYKYELGAVDVPNWTLVMFRRGARWARGKNTLTLLAEALGRWAEHERLAFAHARRLHGLASREMLRHVAGRAWATLRDGLRKLRSPERSLTAPRPGEAAIAGPGSPEKSLAVPRR